MEPNLQRLAVLLQGPGDESLRRIFGEWAQGLFERTDLASTDPGLTVELRRLGETGGLEEMATIFAEADEKTMAICMIIPIWGVSEDFSSETA